MTDLITIKLSRELPNGEVLSHQYQITEISAENDDVGRIFESLFAEFMAEYAYVKDSLNKR